MNTPAAIREVAGLVAVVELKPTLAPLTETVIALPRWSLVKVKVLFVAPVIAVPSAFH